MREFAVADINADMRNAVAARIEEYEIACAKFVLVDLRSHLSLRTACPFQIDAELCEYILREA
ncbi:hypothetical protein D3C84_1089160 [compost metagenome]